MLHEEHIKVILDTSDVDVYLDKLKEEHSIKTVRLTDDQFVGDVSRTISVEISGNDISEITPLVQAILDKFNK